MTSPLFGSFRDSLFSCAQPLVALAVLAGVARAQTPVFVNEFHYDNAGTDVGEFVEVAGPAGTDLTGWSIVLYNGSGGATYGTFPLTGTIANQCGGFGTISVATAGLQNGVPDGFALVDAGSSVVQFLSYEGTLTATNGPATGLTSVDIGVAQPGTDPIGFSIQLTGSGSVYEDFVWTTPVAETPGACNAGQILCAQAFAASFGAGNSHAIHGAATLVTTSPPAIGTVAELQFQYASLDPDIISLVIGIIPQSPPLLLIDAPILIDLSQFNFSVPFGTNNMGATLQISVANDQALCTGVSFYMQAFLLDITTPGTAFGLVASNGVQWTIGAP